ncbi:sporulation protein [Streptomyces sp. NPDC048606]|uniref:sporulation protein n=1 Tax=Streptomyces sp. NPDC048606 TaxID=3154726 RepID=UPI0034144817
MVFKRLLGSLGLGGPTVDTVPDPFAALPGGTLGGQVHLKGGAADFTVEHVTLELIARVEAEHEHGESDGVVVFESFTVAGGFRLAAGEERDLPFAVTLPWETPVTELHGQSLGVVLGLRTELGIAAAKDKGDLDPVAVRPLPVQEAVLEAFGQLGFGFRSADLELGHIRGTGQRLPFYQEIELTPPAAYAHRVEEIEVTFLAGPDAVEVVLEADRRGGPFSDGHDAVGRHTVAHADVPHRNWNAEVEGWIRHLVEYRAGHDGGLGGDLGGARYADKGHGARRGPGAGAVVAAGAAGLAVGVVGGLVAAEVVDEVGDFFEGDDDEGDEA